MKRILFYISFCNLFLALWSCGPESRKTEETVLEHGSDSLAAIQEEPVRKTDLPAGDTLSFEIAGQQFFQAVQVSDTTALNQFIHPQLGLWIAEQPGAVPRFTHVKQIQDFKREYQQRPFFTINQELKTCELQKSQFPKFDCAEMDNGRTGYARDGC
ncbi:MAG: hypothetical protein LPK19_03095, partial [Hymenobacteraceae bacterium]|nr:hypothetical protein [Hymenobacteraceae bacterium]MDX5395176.1 hypothetical protein [Hymenobacteraceae bacterium]MDX5511213.1 hypothetical protein [Hymenobacteraceae bacterium]